MLNSTSLGKENDFSSSARGEQDSQQAEKKDIQKECNKTRHKFPLCILERIRRLRQQA